MSVDKTTEDFATFSHKNSLIPKEMEMFQLLLTTDITVLTSLKNQIIVFNAD